MLETGFIKIFITTMQKNRLYPSYYCNMKEMQCYLYYKVISNHFIVFSSELNQHCE